MSVYYFTSLQASIGRQDKMSRESTVLDQPLNSINNPSVQKDSDPEKKNIDDNDNSEWELRLIDNKTKTWAKVVDALVEVPGSSNPDASKTMMNANKSRFARVGNNKLWYKVAENILNKRSIRIRTTMNGSFNIF